MDTTKLKVINSAAFSIFLQRTSDVCHKYGKLCIRLDSDKNSGWWLPVLDTPVWPTDNKAEFSVYENPDILQI